MDQGKVLRSCGGELCAGKLWVLAGVSALDGCPGDPMTAGREDPAKHWLSHSLPPEELLRQSADTCACIQTPKSRQVTRLSQTLAGALAPRDWVSKAPMSPL